MRIREIEVKRRVTNKMGQRYSDDMIATTGNAACSIALRNAAFRVIPMALIKPVYEAAKKLAIGDSKSLVQRRAASVEHFGKMGVTKEMICAALGIRSTDDIQLDHLEILIGYSTAIKDGDASVDDIFKPSDERAHPEKPTSNPYAEPDAATPNTSSDLKGAIPEEPQAAPEPEAPVQDDAVERAVLLAEIRKAIKPTECSTPATFAPRCREAGLLEVGVQLAACPLEDLRPIAANAADIAEGNYIPLA